MVSLRFLYQHTLLIFTTYTLKFITCAPPMFPYFPPYYNPQAMMHHMPPPYPSYYPPYQSPMMPGMMPPQFMNPGFMNPSYMNFGPGAGSIAAALNLPSASSQVGVSGENIAGQLGNSVQLPIVPKETSIPHGLLSAKVPQPANPQIGASAIFPQIPNEPEKTAPVPILY